MNGLYKSIDKNKLYFEYVGPTKDGNFYIMILKNLLVK